MSFTTDELRQALQTYADDVPLPDAGALVAGAEHKRSHARKVRTAVIAGAAAVLMAVVTVIGIQGIGNEKALTPAQLNKKHHTHFAEYTHGLKLTDVVDVPVRQVADPNSASEPANAASVTLPHVGSNVYISCDKDFVTGSLREPSADADLQTQLRGSSSGFASCDPSLPAEMGAARPGERESLWIVTNAKTEASTAPVAIYTQVDWDDYPLQKRQLTSKPVHQPTKSEDGRHRVVFTGTGAMSVNRTVTVPMGGSRSARLTVSPSAPGRFQVLVDGKAQRLDYTGAPAQLGGPYAWSPPGFDTTVRDEWLDYWPDAGQGSFAGMPATIASPPRGSTVTIAVRAVDTTGPWKAVLTWQTK